MKLKLISLLLICTSCIEFRMSDEKAILDFEELDLAPEFGDLAVDDRTMHYAFLNNQRDNLVVFVHGSPGSWSAFIDYFKADSLYDQVDFLSIDRPGFGESDFGRAEPSMERQAYLLHEVAKLFPHKNKILIGHSLGGPVIARMAMDYPHAYMGLVFVAASIDPEMEKDEWYRGVIDTRVGGFFTPKEFEVSNEEILPLKNELGKMIPLWQKISIPSVLIHGTEDSLVPKENVDFAERMLIDSLTEVRLLEGVNHFIPWSHPGEIIRAINQILATAP